MGMHAYAVEEGGHCGGSGALGIGEHKIPGGAEERERDTNHSAASHHQETAVSVPAPGCDFKEVFRRDPPFSFSLPLSLFSLSLSLSPKI
jgi:hypothetical protein